MNTKAVKSFGLALMLAAGVLAVLLALGTFSPQKAGGTGDRSSDSVAISPDYPLPARDCKLFQCRLLTPTSGQTIYGGEEIVVGNGRFRLARLHSRLQYQPQDRNRCAEHRSGVTRQRCCDRYR